ncbi:hypothetical protein D3C72_1383330 [compost metagenome]
MRGVEAQGTQVAKTAHLTAIVGRAQSIAAVFDQPQPIAVAQFAHHLEVERVAQGMRQHDGLGARADGRLDQRRINVVGAHFDVNKHRDRTKLQDRVDGGGEARRHADDFITFANGAIPQTRRGQGGKCQQVGRRTGVGGQYPTPTEVTRQTLLERLVEASSGQPTIEHGLSHGL